MKTTAQTSSKNQSPAASNRTPAAPDLNREEVAARAYAIWENEGRLDGCETDHWLRAERELRDRREPATLQPSASGDTLQKPVGRSGSSSSSRSNVAG